MEYKLFLDDIRFPKPFDNWHIVRSYNQFVSHIEKYGLPIEMSLDHDLGEELTGYDCIKWMINEKQYDLRNIKIKVHSMNPIGKENIEFIINNWNNFLNNEDHLNKY